MGKKRSSTQWRTLSPNTTLFGRQYGIEIVEISRFEG